MTNEHPFAQYIRILGKGRTGSRSLSQQEAEQAMTLILRGETEAEQVGAFLMLLRVKEESPEEIAGFVRACRTFIGDHARQNISVDLDWSSYAGKRRQPHWYLLAALALANHGYKLFIHGARGHTAGRVYTQDVFEQFGLPIATNWPQASEQIATHNISFMSLGTLCQPLQDLIQLRHLFGLRSPVHSLCRLLNPADATATLQSVFHPSYAATHQGAAQLLGEHNAMVIKGDAGEFEYRPQANIEVRQISNRIARSYTVPRVAQAKMEAGVDLNRLRNAWTVEPAASNTETQAITGTIALALLAMGEDHHYDAALAMANTIWQERDKNLLDRFTRKS